MLNGTLPLWDIADTEAFCAAIIRRSGLELNHQDREDLLCYLIGTAWELSQSYRPGGMRFSAFATYTLKRRIADQQRSRYRTKWQFATHTYTRPTPTLVSLDDQLGHAHTHQPVDSTPDRSPDLMRLLTKRDSPDTGYDHSMGEPPARAATG